MGLFLVGGSTIAQNWVPSSPYSSTNTQNWVPATSPYGTWRQPAQAGKPVPNSWRELKPAGAPADTEAGKDNATPTPPPAPAAQQPPQSLPIQAAIEPPVVLPAVKAAREIEVLPPVKVTQDAEPMPPLPPPPAPISGKSPAVIPMDHEAENASQLPQPPQPYTIKPAKYQPLGIMEDRRGSEEQTLEQTIQLTPPGPERIFRLESEAALNERMRQEGKSKTPPEKIAFPDEPVVSRDEYPGRHWPPQTEEAEPNYVCYGRLLFEDKNTERYGWDFGILQPIFSAGKFYADVVALPYHIATAPCRWYECSAGQCLPGDSVPYLCYPPELSITGGVAEAGTIAGLLAIFP